MALPTLTLPKYDICVPSTGEKISYRPFLVKEEKILLIALESGEYPMIAKAIKDIVKACTYDQLDADNLPIFDLCYMFINIRAKSVGETAEPVLTCQECGFQNPTEVNLTEIQVKGNIEQNKKISLGKNIGIVLKYPVLNTEEEKEYNISIKSIADCVEMIYDGDNVYKASETSSDELISFIENLTHHQFENILEFFASIPKLSHTVNYKCAKCEKENEIILEGIGDFFL